MRIVLPPPLRGVFGSTPDLLSGLYGGVVDQLEQFWHSQIPFSMEPRSSNVWSPVWAARLTGIVYARWVEKSNARLPDPQTLRVSENP
jgi:hypothetical protein